MKYIVNMIKIDEEGFEQRELVGEYADGNDAYTAEFEKQEELTDSGDTETRTEIVTIKEDGDEENKAPKLIVRNLRLGYDGGGVGCGPVEGNAIVELMVTDENGENYFITVTQMMEYQHTYVSEVPYFDLLMHLMRSSVSFDHEFEKIKKYALEDYDYVMEGHGEESEDLEKMKESRFYQAIHLARLAVDEYISEDGEDYESAQNYIEEYRDKDLYQFELPEIPVYEEDMYEEEEIEEE